MRRGEGKVPSARGWEPLVAILSLRLSMCGLEGVMRYWFWMEVDGSWCIDLSVWLLRGDGGMDGVLM